MTHQFGETDSDDAIIGTSGSGVGVRGISDNAQGVWGEAKTNGSGVIGKSYEGVGVKGISDNAQGVWGEAKTNGSGVIGESYEGVGVKGISEKAQGVWGEAKAEGRSGVYGVSEEGSGVKGESKNPHHAGVYGIGPKLAEFFQGDVEVTGDIRIIGADVAEQFEVVGSLSAEPGFVMVLAGDNTIRVSDTPYDRRVAGVLSGAGSYKPALVLDNRSDASNHKALALSGKVWVLADADQGEIEIGDLLTTALTPGHAMKASDPTLSFGAVIGKALHPLKKGKALIPILVALQ